TGRARPRRRFNGAVDEHRRRRAAPRARRATPARFNGAVDEHRRRRAHTDDRREPQFAASMEPSMNIDGDADPRTLAVDVFDASMEPSMNIDGDWTTRSTASTRSVL